MNTLNLGSEGVPEGKKKSKNRNLKIALGLAAVILIPVIGSTLAGSITVSGGAVEFGQGVVTATACDSQITVTPSSVLTGGVFNLESITVSNIDNTTCTAPRYFTIKVLNETSTAQVIGTSSAIYCKVQFVTGGTSLTNTTGCIVSGSTTTGFAVAPAVTLLASRVSSITLESSSS